MLGQSTLSEAPLGALPANSAPQAPPPAPPPDNVTGGFVGKRGRVRHRVS